MVYRYETFRDDKGIVDLQSLKVSCLSLIPNGFYELPKLKNCMCELCTFSQIRSHIVVNISLYDCVHASITIPLISRHSNYSKPFMILSRYSCAKVCFYAYFMIFKESLINLQDVRWYMSHFDNRWSGTNYSNHRIFNMQEK